MMDWTDRHDRYLLRLLSPHALLYTEMITAAAVLRGDRDRLLGYSAEEHPVAVQLGGSQPSLLAEAAKIAEGYGYDEINLNCGCPSPRVQSGNFGASLMSEPALVAQCVEAMRAAVSVPVTVKCRIGIDDQVAERTLPAFVDAISKVGASAVVIHARKAWLEGLSPKENRNVPPLDYEIVYAIKRQRPDLPVVINGGIDDAGSAMSHLAHVDGVMVGRAAYQTPYRLAEIDRALYGGEADLPSRLEVAERFADYVEKQCARGVPFYGMVRHILGLFQGERGARAFRRHISEQGPRPGAGVEVLHQALRHLNRPPQKAQLERRAVVGS